MGGVDLCDMLIALYGVKIKTKRWYIKICWHVVDVAKVNGWLLYRHHQTQLGIARKKIKTLKTFSIEIGEVLIHTMNKSILL